MTADSPVGSASAGPTVDLFLLAGQFPGASAAEALTDCVAYAEQAEEHGFGGVWLAEHHFIRYGVCASAVALAGYLLGRTHRITVGTAAAILSNRHPVALAAEASLLAAASGGRFRLGVARGGPWLDLEVFGTGLARYERGFAPALDLLLGALAGPVAAEDDFFAFRPVELAVRAPMPVWVAATSPASVELAARRGQPLLLGVHETDPSRRHLLDHYRASGGPADAEHASAHLAYVGDPADLRAAMPGWLATTADYVRLDGSAGRDQAGYLDHLLAVSPVGTAAHCAARLRATVEHTGIRRLLLLAEGAGSRAATLANIAALGDLVL